MDNTNKKTRQILLSFYYIFFHTLFFSVVKLTAQPFPAYTAIVYDPFVTGYYFVSPKAIKPIRETNLILDHKGEVIYFRNWPVGVRASDFKLQPNGMITYSDKQKFYVMDSLFNTVDTIKLQNGIMFNGHDIQFLPNGNYLMIGSESVMMDLSAYHLFKGNSVAGSQNASVLCNVIQEQDSASNVVFEWHARDFYSFEDIDTTFLYDTNDVDWNHCNAVELDYDGNILLSTRHFNEITKINHSDSSIMWRLGGNKNQFTFINDTIQFKAQHDIRRLPNGNITLFDNGKKNPHHPAIAKEYALDEVLLTADLVWSYTYSPACYSSSRGNVQRLANGNTVVNYGTIKDTNITFSYINPAGLPLFDIRFADTLCSYRAFFYPVIPWSLNRPDIKCSQTGGQIFLSVDTGYNSYLWSTGDTTPAILISNPDTYYVFVPKGTGGFIKSEVFIVSDSINPCQLNEVTPLWKDTFYIFPNPVTEDLMIHFSYSNKQPPLIEISDIMGNRISLRQTWTDGKGAVSMKTLPAGIYFVCCSGAWKKVIKL